jgi:hypothetical protein
MPKGIDVIRGQKLTMFLRHNEKNRCNKRTKIVNVNITFELLGLSCKIEAAHLMEA